MNGRTPAVRSIRERTTPKWDYSKRSRTWPSTGSWRGASSGQGPEGFEVSGECRLSLRSLGLGAEVAKGHQPTSHPRSRRKAALRPAAAVHDRAREPGGGPASPTPLLELESSRSIGRRFATRVGLSRRRRGLIHRLDLRNRRFLYTYSDFGVGWGSLVRFLRFVARRVAPVSIGGPFAFW